MHLKVLRLVRERFLAKMLKYMITTIVTKIEHD